MSDYLSDISKEKDNKRVIMSATNLGNNPSRAEIEALLQQDGGSLPIYDVTFYLIDTNDHNISVTYIKDLNSYFYVSLTKAS